MALFFLKNFFGFLLTLEFISSIIEKMPETIGKVPLEQKNFDIEALLR